MFWYVLKKTLQVLQAAVLLVSRHHVFPDEASATLAARVWLDIQVSVSVALEVAFVFKLLSAKLAAVQLAVLAVDGRQVARESRLPPEHFSAQLALDFLLVVGPHVSPEVRLGGE